MSVVQRIAYAIFENIEITFGLSNRKTAICPYHGDEVAPKRQNDK